MPKSKKKNNSPRRKHKSKHKSKRKHNIKRTHKKNKKYILPNSKVISYSSIDVSKNKTITYSNLATILNQLNKLGDELFGITSNFVGFLRSGHVLPSLTNGCMYNTFSPTQKATLQEIEYKQIGHDYNWFKTEFKKYLKKKGTLAPPSLRKQQIKDAWIRYVNDNKGVTIFLKGVLLSGSIYNMEGRLSIQSSTYNLKFFKSLIQHSPDVYSYIQSYQQRQVIHTQLENIFTLTDEILIKLSSDKSSGGKILIKSKTLTYLEAIWGHTIRTRSGKKPPIILYVQPKHVRSVLLHMITFNEIIKILKNMLKFYPLERNPIYHNFIVWKFFQNKYKPVLEAYKSFIKQHLTIEGGGGGGGVTIDSILPAMVYAPPAPTTLLMPPVPTTAPSVAGASSNRRMAK